MKKLFALFLSVTSVFVLSACLGGTGGEDVDVNIPDEFPEEEVEILIWHAFGDDNMALLDNIFDDFEDMYPNVSIRHVGQGGYDGLRESTIQGNVAGSTPTMVFGYPDHFVEYLQGNSLVPLDDYIDHPEHGTDLEDFVDGFLDENQQYVDGNQYSLPFAKSTEMVVYNKTVMDYFGIEIGTERFLTWQDIQDIADDIVWDEEAVQALTDFDTVEEFEDEFEAGQPHIINIDSAANFFINSLSQWGLEYTNAEGEILFGNQDTYDMLSYYKDLMDDDILSLPIEWDEQYGSLPFKDGDVLMSQGSTAGTRHNIPDQEDGVFGLFEMGIAPVVQYDEDNMAAIQQGPNLAMMADTTDEERLAAWYLMEFMTNTENTAYFSQNTGYVPVRDSAFEDPDYAEFLEIGQADPDDLSDEELNQRPFSMAANVAESQSDIYAFEPPFVGRVTSSNARLESELLLEGIYAGTRDIGESINRALGELQQDAVDFD